MGVIPISNLIPNAGSMVLAKTITAPTAPSATATHANVTLPATGTTTTTTGITQPDVPRNLTVKGNAALIAGNVVINGKNHNGETISETIALNGSTEVVGSKVFATVTSFVVPAKTNASGDAVSIGRGSLLGLGLTFSKNTVLRAYLNGVLEATAPTVAFDNAAVDGNSVLLNSAIPGSQDVVLEFFYPG